MPGATVGARSDAICLKEITPISPPQKQSTFGGGIILLEAIFVIQSFHNIFYQHLSSCVLLSGRSKELLSKAYMRHR